MLNFLYKQQTLSLLDTFNNLPLHQEVKSIAELLEQKIYIYHIDKGAKACSKNYQIIKSNDDRKGI